MWRSDVEMFSNISDTWVRTAGRPPGRTDWMFRVEKNTCQREFKCSRSETNHHKITTFTKLHLVTVQVRKKKLACKYLENKAGN
jgi:hypothetical protein